MSKTGVEVLSGIQFQRDRIRLRLEKLDAERTSLQKLLDSMAQLIETLENFEPDQLEKIMLDVDPEKFSIGADRETSSPKPSEISNHVEAMLREQGRPMTRGQIVAALRNRGLHLEAADVSKNVGTILWRQPDRFINLPKLGYWLTRLPLPGIYESPFEPPPED